LYVLYFKVIALSVLCLLPCPAGLLVGGILLLGRVGFAFIERRPSLLILFLIFYWISIQFQYFLVCKHHQLTNGVGNNHFVKECYCGKIIIFRKLFSTMRNLFAINHDWFIGLLNAAFPCWSCLSYFSWLSLGVLFFSILVSYVEIPPYTI
jgi:hypothetical protein